MHRPAQLHFLGSLGLFGVYFDILSGHMVCQGAKQTPSNRVPRGKASEYQEAVEDLRGAAQQATEGASQCVQQDSHTR